MHSLDRDILVTKCQINACENADILGNTHSNNPLLL